MSVHAHNLQGENGPYRVKTPVSLSTVKRRLWDAGLLGRVTKKKPYLRLANKNKRLRWAKEQTLDRVGVGVASSRLTLRLGTI
jgi:hypothetical protein